MDFYEFVQSMSQTRTHLYSFLEFFEKVRVSNHNDYIDKKNLLKTMKACLKDISKLDRQLFELVFSHLLESNPSKADELIERINSSGPWSGTLEFPKYNLN